MKVEPWSSKTLWINFDYPVRRCAQIDVSRLLTRQEIWANAHETRNSISI